MYARVSDDFKLRGWYKLPYALVNRNSGAVMFFNEEGFGLFSYLDGQYDLDCVFLSPLQRALFDSLCRQKAVDLSREPFPAALPCPLAGYRQHPCRAVTLVHWSITGACNLKCRHCYISAPHYKYHDLDTASCMRLTEQMAEAGVAGVSLSGGEPLLRKDFWVIVDGLRAAGIPLLSIFTNALLADDVFLDGLAKRRISCSFVVSFDGLGRHDWLRGIPGSEEKTIAAIRRIAASRLPLCVNTVFHSRNIDTMLPTYEFLVGLGVDVWRPGHIGLMGEWITTSQASSAPEPLPRETLWERYYELARHYIADGQPLQLQLVPCFAAWRGPGGRREIPAIKPRATADGLESHSCSSCRIHPSLMPDGRLFPCPAITALEMDADMPNLLESSLVEVYSHPEKPFFSVANIRVKEVLAANEGCRDCAWRLECGGGCRAQAAMGGQGLLGRDSDLCAFFKDGWRERFGALVDSQP